MLRINTFLVMAEDTDNTCKWEMAINARNAGEAIDDVKILFSGDMACKGIRVEREDNNLVVYKQDGSKRILSDFKAYVI